MIGKLRNSRAKMKHRFARGEGEKMKAKEKKGKLHGEVRKTKMKTSGQTKT